MNSRGHYGIITLDHKCKTESSNVPVSYTCAIVSAILIVFTVPANAAIIISIIRHGRLLHRNFYFIIANIAIADLICGLLTSPISVNHHLKEVHKNYTLPQGEVRLLHLSFFITNAVSVLSMTALSVDRLGVLLYPFVYYEKVTRLRIIFILVCTWFLSIGMAVSYIWIGYIRYLTIFAVMTVMLTMLVMIATMVLFKYRLIQSRRDEAATIPSTSDTRTKETKRRHRCRSLHHFTQVDQKITKTFLWMLLLFLVNYSPAVIVATFINICTNCRCHIVHVMRDIVFLPILTSGLWRAILFIMKLKVLRNAIKSVIQCNKVHSDSGRVYFHSQNSQESNTKISIQESCWG